MKRVVIVLMALALSMALVLPVFAGGEKEGAAAGGTAPITLVGGTMLPQNHIFYRHMLKFKELFEQYYQGSTPVNFDLYDSGAIGTEKDMIEYMMQGVSVDFGIISPAWAATWDQTAPLIDAPFLFRNLDHWEKSITQGALKPIEDNMIAKGVRFIGYGGGSTRNLILNQPISKLEDLPKITLRVQGSTLHQRAFAAFGVQPTPLDYMEVYNAIKTGVVDGLENEPAGLEGMKFYEVAPYYVMTQHQIITRINAFSEPRLQSFPEDVRAAIIRAGKEAGEWHRKTEPGEAKGILDRLSKDYGLKVIEFSPEQIKVLQERVTPVIAEYAKEIGAGAIYDRIMAIK